MTRIKDIQSGDTNEISAETPCLIIGGIPTGDTAVNGANATAAREDARGRGAYGVTVSTVGAWTSGPRSGDPAYVQEPGVRGAPWWLSEVAI